MEAKFRTQPALQSVQGISKIRFTQIKKECWVVYVFGKSQIYLDDKEPLAKPLDQEVAVAMHLVTLSPKVKDQDVLRQMDSVQKMLRIHNSGPKLTLFKAYNKHSTNDDFDDENSVKKPNPQSLTWVDHSPKANEAWHHLS